jgi:hypothetical protein
LKTHVAISREIFKKTVAGKMVKFYEHLRKVGYISKPEFFTFSVLHQLDREII